MKFFYLLFIICLLSVDAQRRSVKSELLSENEPPPKTARRGRARFTVTSDAPQIEEQRSETPSRRAPPRRRLETRTEASPARANYEVEENVDDVPIETFRRNFKSKVLTENKFEARNALPSNNLFQPSTTENIDDIIKSDTDTTFSPLPESSSASSSLEPSPSEFLSSEIPNEITKTQPETTTPVTTKTTRRSHERSRGHVASSPTVASRVRTRTRTNRRQEEPESTTTSRVINRASRRRSEVSNAETRVRPSAIASAESVEVPTRSRTGRKLPNRRPSEDFKPTENVPNSRRANVRKNSEPENKSNYVPIQTRTNTIRKSVEPENEVQLPSRRKNNESRKKPTESTTFRSRSRFRTTDVPPVLPEQKLEVLPLFERESKTVKPIRKFVSRRRHLNSAEVVETSATENEVKIAPQPQKQSVVVETRTESNIRRRKVVKKNIKPTKTTTISTTTSTTTPKPSVRIVKESVVSEISEVTSKRTVTRRKTPTKTNTVAPPKFVTRVSKNVNGTTVKKNKSGLTSSEEEIDESDNYPEPFKQLIQAKKHKKESRPQHRLVTSSPVTKTTEKVVNSSPSSTTTTTTQVISTEAIRQLEDSENELDPTKVPRTTRRRYTQTTEKTVRTTRKNKFARSTAVPRFQAKANLEVEATTSKGFSPKPTRGLYSSRKTKESLTKSKSATVAQIPIPKKSNRYSSRYRNDASSRNAIRTSTNAPAYLPTIPTVTPPTTSVKSPYQDKDLGVEVISFDDPVNTVPSANLVSGEYLASSTENHLTSSLVSASQTKTTEKPVSIIERIINSITAISTTEVPDVTRLTTPSQATPAKESAILKLATKKLDKTQTTQKTLTVTSEKPTTIIERILTSLSAIQADNTTDTKKFNSKQVGTNFNTISSPSTTPITRVTKSTLSAQFSTTVNPLFVLDEISNEQTLQKRTIDKLLELLNTLTTPHSPQLVVVTPKSTSYVVGTSAATTTTTTEPTTTTTEPTTSTTTSQLFTSPSSNVSLESRANIPTSTVRYTQTPTITTLSTQPPTTTTPVTTSTLSSSETIPTTDISNEISPLPLSIESGVTDFTTSSPTDSSTINSSTPPRESSTQSTTDSSTITSSTPPRESSTQPTIDSSTINSSTPPRESSTPSSTDSSTITSSTPQRESSTQSTIDSSTISSTLPSTDFNFDTDTAFAFPSTLPALVNFEVSPGSVSIFSANDLYNLITPEDSSSTTVTILGKTNTPETVITTQTSTEVTPIQTTTPVSNSSDSTLTTQNAVTVQNRFGDSTTTENNPSTDSATTTDSSNTVTAAPTTTTVAPSATTVASNAATVAPTATTVAPTTTDVAPTTTQSLPTTDSGDANNTTQDISSNIIDTTGSPEKSNQTSTVNPPTNTTSRSSGRSGRLLNILQDPVQNSIETSTTRDKDYFIFAVLNNNTVLRKRPSRFPTKDTPYLVVGVYPNNTIVRKFPNGTLVPMEPIVRVSGFDTRENPPPLPEITSNQVTPDQGSRPDNKNLQTVEQNTIPPLQANALSLTNVNNTSTTEATSSSTVSTVQANPLSISSTSTTEAAASSTVSTVQANPLSISSTSISTTTSSSTSSSSSSQSMSSTTPGTTTTTTGPTATLPTLTEILNGRTVKAFNSIINISDLSKVQTLEVDPKTNRVLNTEDLEHNSDVVFRWRPVTSPTYSFDQQTRQTTTTMLPTTTLSNRILDDNVASTITMLPTTTRQRTTTTAAPTTTTAAPTTTAPPTTSTLPPTTTATFTTTKATTVLPLTQPATTTYRSTTMFPSTTTFFPTFLTTLFSTLRPRRLSTEGPITIVTPISNRVPPTTTPRVEISTNYLDMITASSTRRTSRVTTVPTTNMPSTLPISTTVRSRRRGTTTTAQPPTTIFTTTIATTLAARSARRSTKAPEETTTISTKKLRKLTEQQKKDLETLAQLEQEQAAILKQLAFLTNLNFANPLATPIKTTTEKSDLANRIIALAVERDGDKSTTTTEAPSTTERKRQAKKIASNDQNVEQLLKQLNIATPSTITSQYGKSEDAIIAALLKEQGIGPTTPKALEDIYALTTTTTRKPKTTTRRPGPLMQSLNWLLNVLAPPTTTTKRPKPKSKKPKPKPQPNPDELLTHQPTHITPVVTPAPRKNIVSALSQTDVQKLIKQLEAIQKNPGNNDLDLSSIKSLQALLDAEEGVKVTSSGTTGTTTRITTPATTTILTTTKKKKNKNRVVKSTTAVPLSVSNSISDDVDSTTPTGSRINLPPVRLRPVPGVEEDETLVRGQLITAAVNVTRAISSFLGTALQGAASGFQTLWGSGSRAIGSLMQVSSNTSSRPG